MGGWGFARLCHRLCQICLIFKGKEDDIEIESNPAEQNEEGIKENDGDKNNNITGD